MIVQGGNRIVAVRRLDEDTIIVDLEYNKGFMYSSRMSRHLGLGVSLSIEAFDDLERQLCDQMVKPT